MVGVERGSNSFLGNHFGFRKFEQENGVWGLNEMKFRLYLLGRRKDQRAPENNSFLSEKEKEQMKELEGDSIV